MSTDFMDYLDIVEQCDLSVKGICEEYGFNRKSFLDWITFKSNPRQKNKERLVKAMGILIDQKKMIKHPSFGFATEEQIKRLQEMGLGPDRDYLLKQIEKQNKLNGKRK